MKQAILFFLLTLTIFSCNNGEEDGPVIACLSNNSDLTDVIHHNSLGFATAIKDSLIAHGWNTNKYLVIQVNDYTPECVTDNLDKVQLMASSTLGSWLTTALVNKGWNTTKDLTIIP